MCENVKTKIKNVLYNSNYGILFIGLLSFIWLVIRSGKKPSRLAYPCQRAAASQSIGFMGYLVFAGSTSFHRIIRVFSRPFSEGKSSLSRLSETKRITIFAGLVTLTFLFSSLSWQGPGIKNIVFTDKVSSSSLSYAAFSGTAPVNKAVVAIVSSENSMLDQPADIDALLSYDQVKDIVWTALDLDTSDFSLLNIVEDNDWVVIKTNIVTAPLTLPNGTKKTNYWFGGVKHKGQNTDLRVIKSTIEYLVEHKSLKRITIAEGSAEWGKLGGKGTNKSFTMDGWTVHWPEFGNLSYVDIVNDINALHPNLVDIVDLSYDDFRYVSVPDPNNSGIGGLYRDTYAMPATLLDCDKWIDIPTMKTHKIPGISLIHKLRIGTLANQAYSENPNTTYSEMHQEGDDGVIRGLIDLFSYQPSDYAIIQGFWGTEGDGPQWGDDIKRNVIIAGYDPVATEAVAASAMGFNPWDLEYLHLSAAKGFGTFDFDNISILGNTIHEIHYDFKKSTGFPSGSTTYIGRSNRTWLINGIHQGEDLDEDYLNGETSIVPEAGMISGGQSWQLYTSPQNKIDLKQIFGSSANSCIVYAFTYVQASEDISTNLWIGNDDCIKVWVNKQVVFNDPSSGSYQIAEHKIPISLHKGINTVLCKILNYSGEFEFSLNICDDESDTPAEIEYLTDYINTQPCVPILVSPQNDTLTNNQYPEITWQVPADDNGDSLHFKVELNTDSTFGSETRVLNSKDNSKGFSPYLPVAQGTGTVSYSVQSALSDGEWWWRVSAWDGRDYGSPSQTRKIVIDTTPPRLDTITFLDPGYGNYWYNQSVTSRITVRIQYDELHASKAFLNSGGLQNLLENIDIMSGEDKVTEFTIQISDAPDGHYLCTAILQDQLGHTTSDTASVQLDKSPPVGAEASSPDTSDSGMFTVRWGDTASDSSGCGLSGYFDVRVKIGDGSWNDWLVDYEGQEHDFKAEQYNQIYYYFEAASKDNLGNKEEFIGVAECSTYVDTVKSGTDMELVINQPLPKEFCLKQNYPNPFNSTTVIGYDLPRIARVNLVIYNSLGEKIVQLLKHEYHSPGRYKIIWDGRDNMENEVPAGLYVYSFYAEGLSAVKKLLYIK